MNTYTKTRSNSNLFQFQQRAFPFLLAWSLFSIVVGILAWIKGDRWLRGLGMQFAGWGLIDGIIAAFAVRGAVHKSIQLASGEITPPEYTRQARNFKAIVLANALLDIGYIFGGSWLIKRFPQDQEKRGMGWGIIIQGAFLLIWDLVLALFSPGGKHER